MIKIKSADRLNEVKTYYFATKLQQIAEMNKDGKDVINLGIGNPDLSPPGPVIEKLKNIIKTVNNGYQSYSGITELRSAISNWYLNSYGVSLNEKKNILPLIGSKEAIFHIAQAFLNPGDEVLVPNPGYPAYASTALMAGAKVIRFPLLEENDWQPDFEYLNDLDLTKVKVLWCNYPNMPTGANARIETFERLISFGKKHNILICHDNPYSFVLNDKPKSIFQSKDAFDCCIELNSLSKSHHLAGWRIGMLIAHPRIIAEVLKVKSNIDSGSYKGIQLAAVEALKTERNWHDQQNAIYLKRKILILELFKLLKCNPYENTNGMFVWAKIPTSTSSAEEFSELLLTKANVFITPGFIFGSKGKHYLRASLCVTDEKITEAINRIKTIV